MTKDKHVYRLWRLAAAFGIALILPAVSFSAPVSPSVALARTHYQLGTQYLREGMKQKAREEFQQAADRDSAFFEAQLQTALLLNGENQPAQAVRYFERALAVKPDRADLHLAAADLCVALGDTITAIRHFTDCVQNSPTQTRALLTLARYSIQSKDYQGAINWLEKSSELARDRSALVLKGWCYHQIGNLERAADAYRRALQIDPNDGELHLNLGLIEAARGRKDEAAVEFERAAPLVKEKDKAQTWRYLGLVQVDLGRDEQAVLSFQRALGADDRDVVARFQLAKALFRLGRMGEAAREFVKLQNDGVQAKEIAAMGGMALMKSGDYVQAMEMLKLGLKAEPNNTDLLEAMAECCKRLNRKDEARQILERLLALRPNDIPIYRALSDLYLEAGQPARALELERRGHEISLRQELDQALTADRAVWQKRIETIETDAARQVAEARRQSEERVRGMEQETQRKVGELRRSVDSRVAEVELSAASEIRRARAEADSRVKLVEELSRRKIAEFRAGVLRVEGETGAAEGLVEGLRAPLAGQLLAAYDSSARLLLEETQRELEASRQRLAKLENENRRLRLAAPADTAGMPAVVQEMERRLQEAERVVAAYQKKVATLENRLLSLSNQLSAAQPGARETATAVPVANGASLAELTRKLAETQRELALLREAARGDSRIAVARFNEVQARLTEADRRFRELKVTADRDSALQAARLSELATQLALASSAATRAAGEANRDSAALSARLLSLDEKLNLTLAEAEKLRLRLAEVSADLEKERAVALAATNEARRARAEADSTVMASRLVLQAVSSEVEGGLREIGADTSARAGVTVPERLRFFLLSVRLAADARVARIQLETEGRLSEIQKRTDVEVSRILKDAQAQIDRARYQAAEEVRRAQVAADSEVIRRVAQEREKLAAEALAKRLAMAERLRAEIEAEAQVRLLEEKAGVEASFEADRIRLQREYDQQLQKFQTEYQRRLEAAQLEARRASDQLEALTRNDTALLARSDLYQRVVRENAMMREDQATLRRRLEELSREREGVNLEASRLRNELANVQARLGAVEDEARRYRGVGVLTESLQRGVNVNVATVDDLQVLPGIGIQEARNIVWYRENVGPFRDTDELTKVPGLDAAKARAIRGLIRVR